MPEVTTVPVQRVAITGGLGNLATKLFRHLATQPGITHLVGLDRLPAPPNQAAQTLAGLDQQVTLDYVECDLADGHDPRWRQALTGMDAVVHFAADNPYPQGYSQCTTGVGV